MATLQLSRNYLKQGGKWTWALFIVRGITVVCTDDWRLFVADEMAAQREQYPQQQGPRFPPRGPRQPPPGFMRPGGPPRPMGGLPRGPPGAPIARPVSVEPPTPQTLVVLLVLYRVDCYHMAKRSGTNPEIGTRYVKFFNTPVEWSL